MRNQALVRLGLFAALSLWFALNSMGQSREVASKDIEKTIGLLARSSELDSTEYMSLARQSIRAAMDGKRYDMAALGFQHLISYLNRVAGADRAYRELLRLRELVERTNEGSIYFYRSWHNVIVQFYNETNPLRAVNEFQEMQLMAEAKGDDYGLACAYASFGAISEYAYDAGIENFYLALEHLQRAERSEEIFYLYNEMAELAHLNMKEDDVLKFLDMMEKAAGNPTKTDPLSLYLRLLVHLAQNNEKEAQRIYEKLLALWKSGGIESPYLDNNAKALCLYNCKYGDPEEAMDLLAYVNTPYEKLEIQIAYYKRKGLWANALNLTERYDSILKSLIIDAQRTKVINASAFYKNKELAAHNLELQFASTKSRIIWLSLLLLVVIIGTAAFNLSTRRHNKLLMAERDHTEEERKKAVKLSEMKTAFIQNISHEVRTPLNSIMGFNDLLNNSPEEFSPDERQEMVNQINVMSNRLASLLDTIIFISRLDSEDIKPNISRFPLSGVLAEINAAVANQTTPGVRLEMEQALSTPLFVKADRDLFTRALSAVVENAVKFTQSGSIKLEVAERPGDTLEVSVTDTGCGIPTDSAELIFERFEKLNSFEPGFGLGLSTAREVLGMMGCAIRLDKSYTEGARFIITANR